MKKGTSGELIVKEKYDNSGYLFVLPNMLGFLSFTLLPVIASLILSFYRWNIITKPVFVGISNFSALMGDKNFWYYLGNTLYFMLNIPLGMAFSLFLAILVDRSIKGIGVYRLLYFLPYITPIIASAIVWRLLYQSDYGLINQFLRFIGISNPPRWLGNPNLAKPAIIIANIWHGSGQRMILYLAALQGIPKSYYEAAEIDGASGWQKFIYITLPQLSFINFFIVIMGVINGFRAFGVQYVMTEGGPAGATTTIVYYIYNNAFRWFRMGYASAISWVLFILMFIFTIIQWKYKKGEVV